MNIREDIKLYIGDELLEEEGPITDDENLLADGMVDSLGMLRLVSFIEESYDFRVPPADFTIENFRTIETIVAYLFEAIESKGTTVNGG